MHWGIITFPGKIFWMLKAIAGLLVAPAELPPEREEDEGLQQ